MNQSITMNDDPVYGTQPRLIEKNMIFEVKKGYNRFKLLNNYKKELTKEELEKIKMTINVRII